MRSFPHATTTALLAASFGLFFPATLSAAIHFAPAAPGNVFYVNESVTVPLRCDGDRLEWSVTDFYGAVVRTGTGTPVAGAAILQPAPGRRGYFELRVVEKRGAVRLSEKTTRFAILTEPDTSIRDASPFGVQTHSAQGGTPAVYALLAKAGVVHFRDEHYWGSIETARSRYAYPARFGAFMAAATAAGMQPLLTLDWANPLYDYEAGMFTAPHSDAGRAGYAAYGAAVARQYPTLNYVELWNEYNAGTFVAGPAAAAKPQSYKRMLERAAPLIRSARPGVRIVAGGTVPVAHGFLRALFAEGAMPYLDVVSVHPYRATPAGVEWELAELRELIKRHNGGLEKPIWATEFSRVVDGETDQNEAATYLAQIVTLMLSQRVERLYYYLAQDDSSFPFRGLLAADNDPKGALTPHPAYVAYATVIRQLHGHAFHSRFGGTSSSTYAFRFQRGMTRRNVLWAEAPVTVDLKTASTLHVADIMGQLRTVAPVNGVVRLQLTRNPLFIQGPIESVTELDNTLLADSQSGYAPAQGVNGWSYGSVAQPSNATYNPLLFSPMRWDYCGDNAVCWLLGQWHFISVDQMHPSSSWAVRRWTSPVAATVTLSGRIGRGAQGDGVNVGIFVDGRKVYLRALAPGQTTDFQVENVVIGAGSRVDFTVNQGGESSYDSTYFTARVTRR